MRAVCISSVLGLAASNFVSPGLNKCLDLKAELKEDGKTRETLDDMKSKEGPIEVQLYECHGDHNQHYLIVDGKMKSYAIQERCLTAEAVENNANVEMKLCEDGNPTQQWELTGDGYVRVAGSTKCLDVEAKKKDDGSREKWAEIKEHKTVNVHLYECHDPEKTDRVNQLWMWAPFQNGEMVTEKTEQKWALAGSLPGTGSGSSMTMAVAGAMGLFAAGAFVGMLARRAPPQPLAAQEVE